MLASFNKIVQNTDLKDIHLLPISFEERKVTEKSMENKIKIPLKKAEE